MTEETKCFNQGKLAGGKAFGVWVFGALGLWSSRQTNDGLMVQ